MGGYFRRHHDEQVEIKDLDRTTISTFLIPKRLTAELSRVIPRVIHPSIGQVFWDFHPDDDVWFPHPS